MLNTLQCNNVKSAIGIRKDITNQSSTVIETQRLLDGAILAAWNDAQSEKQSKKQHTLPELTAARWVWRLAGSYHTTHRTPVLLRRVAERFVSSGQWDLAKWAAEKAVEEQGHDQLALLDISAMGYDPMTVIEKFIPSAAKELVDYFSMQVEAVNPMGVVGYSHTLERLAMRVNTSMIQSIESALPRAVNATRCLRTHSSIGADANHVKENIEVISRLSLSEQKSIATSCYETAKICFTLPQEGYISELKLQHCLGLRYQLADTDFIPVTKRFSRKSHNIQPQNGLYLQSTTNQLNYLLRTQLQDGLPNDVEAIY